MKVSIKQSLLFCLLAAGITAGASSCVITTHPTHTTKRTTVVKKKSHPHGGPPGQTKKAPGHPGKRHFIAL